MGERVKKSKTPKVLKKGYFEFDLKHYNKTGEVVPVGEPLEVTTIVKMPKDKRNIVFTTKLFNILEKIGNSKVKILIYFLRHIDSQNHIKITYTELSEELGYSRITTTRTLEALIKDGLLKRRGDDFFITKKLIEKRQ